MLTERLYSYLVALWLTSVALGQAPGDHNVLCRTGDNHIFPTEWRILVDTFDYQNLFNPVLISPVWLAESFGGTGNWIQNLGGSCSWQMRVCESSAEDNWLFSQYISYEDAIEVFFDVSYRFVECRPENSCTKNYVTVYGYNRNGISDTQRVITGNYEPLFGSAESSRLQQSGPFTDTETLSFTRSTNSDGLYLGLRDEGTCGNVIRVIMYYVVCPGRVVDLVTYPETAVPVVGSSDITFVAMCASNAHSITSLEVTASSSTNTCTDVAPGGAACECDEGYMLSGDGRSCGACNAGTYRTLNDNSCQSCPGNTELNVVAASECRCVAGFYRTPQEGPEIQCTEPPSEIRNLEVVSSTDTTITIRWMVPSTTGRSDFFYRVSYSDPDNIGNFISSNDNIVSGLNTVTYEVTGLVPFTPYILRVTPHNGVSDQDSNPPISEISAVTMEGIPGMPRVQHLCTAVVWQPPTQTNGVITEYNLLFSSNDESQRYGPDRNFVATTPEHMEPGVTVMVRAVNNAGPGEYTRAQLVCPTPCMLNVTTTSIEPTTITITWVRPDAYSGAASYQIELIDRGMQTLIDSVTSTDSILDYMLSELVPYTPYTLKLTARNNQSSQMCTTVVTTAEGVSSPPSSLMQYCSVLVWKPPMQPNGVITGYTIQFNNGNRVSLRPTENYYQTSDEEKKIKDVSVQIRAINRAGDGLWTEYLPIDCPKDSNSSTYAGIFNQSSTVDILIFVAITFVVTLMIATLIFLCVFCCLNRRNKNKLKSTSDFTEMKLK